MVHYVNRAMYVSGTARQIIEPSSSHIIEQSDGIGEVGVGVGRGFFEVGLIAFLRAHRRTLLQKI